MAGRRPVLWRHVCALVCDNTNQQLIPMPENRSSLKAIGPKDPMSNNLYVKHQNRVFGHLVGTFFVAF